MSNGVRVRVSRPTAPLLAPATSAVDDHAAAANPHAAYMLTANHAAEHEAMGIPLIIVSDEAPDDNDGRPDGTIYIQVS